MAETLLQCAHVKPGFEHRSDPARCGINSEMPECTAGSVPHDPGLADRIPQRSLYQGFVHVVAVALAGRCVSPTILLGEDALPTALDGRVEIFPEQGVRHWDTTPAIAQGYPVLVWGRSVDWGRCAPEAQSGSAGRHFGRKRKDPQGGHAPARAGQTGAHPDRGERYLGFVPGTDHGIPRHFPWEPPSWAEPIARPRVLSRPESGRTLEPPRRQGRQQE